MSRIALLLGSAVCLCVTAIAAAQPARALTNCDTGDFSIDGEEAAFLRIINEYRAANGKGPLTLSTNLNRTAQWMVTDMANKGRFGHTDSLGRDPFVRSVDCGYPLAAGENLAAGTYRDTAAGAFELFRNSPTHNENMLLPWYQQIGIARYYLPGSPYGWYWATEFGTTNDGTGASVQQAPPPAPPPPAPPQANVAAPNHPQPAPPAQKEMARPATETAPPSAVEPSAEAGRSTLVLERLKGAVGAWDRYVSKLPAYLGALSIIKARNPVAVTRGREPRGPLSP